MTSKTFSDLPQDELSVVLQYLPIGSLLMFSLVSKANYDFVRDQVKNNICKYVVYENNSWSLVDALRQKKSMRLSECSNEIEGFMNEIAERNGSISEITSHFKADNISFPDLYHLLDIRKGSEEEEFQQVQVETICLENTPDNKPPQLVGNDEKGYHFEKKMKTIEGEPLTYDLKSLSIDMTLTRSKLLKIMTKLKNLESLNLIVEQEYYRPKTSRGGRGLGGGLFSISSGEDDTQDGKGEAFDDEFIYVPIMKKLKKLVIERGFDDDRFIFEISSFCPNLEHLHFVCRESVDDNMLEHLAKYCPKMKYLKIKSDDGATQFELEITDKGLEHFLEKETQIEVIDLEPAANISGSIFKRLGDFPTLKSFRTQRVSYNGDCSDQEEDIFFGGNTNPNLEYLDIGPGFSFTKEEFEKLFISLKKFAPNLKGFGEIGQVSE
ncbi:predicted protein [Naegleria gruberi]|uniref:Predicted protein n=1 Tax=Naegleria gruberi TaxID=5762 RepID=D2W2D3_NAEGR|nr:uncharacterized protein NAEGRDRAFT_75548 [Naegleria gruberi]EFC36808.1 predicted protein [Naegleria gruberi]|eukprot:XP_002669552.1 predicted protein [Naegleria gruberi strain NEG-M]